MFFSCFSMLYRGADLIRDIEWVIFDEVHYVNDTECVTQENVECGAEEKEVCVEVLETECEEVEEEVCTSVETQECEEVEKTACAMFQTQECKVRQCKFCQDKHY